MELPVNYSAHVFNSVWISVEVYSTDKLNMVLNSQAFWLDDEKYNGWPLNWNHPAFVWLFFLHKTFISKNISTQNPIFLNQEESTNLKKMSKWEYNKHWSENTWKNTMEIVDVVLFISAPQVCFCWEHCYDESSYGFMKSLWPLNWTPRGYFDSRSLFCS